MIFLIGYRGSGKTTVAAALSKRLGWPWLDADHVLEERAGKSIRKIFEDDGEPAFRDLEAAVLRDLATGEEKIIATGGGVVLRPENRDVLKRGNVVWLTAPAEILWQRLQIDPSTGERRPNLAQGGLEEIQSLLAAREPWYRACADVVVESTDNPDSVAARILAVLTPEGSQPLAGG